MEEAVGKSVLSQLYMSRVGRNDFILPIQKTRFSSLRQNGIRTRSTTTGTESGTPITRMVVVTVATTGITEVERTEEERKVERRVMVRKEVVRKEMMVMEKREVRGASVASIASRTC